MRAVIINSYGGIENLEVVCISKPEPKEGEVLINVQAVGVNPIDCKIRSGAFESVLKLRMPCILGHDFAGVVAKVGEAVSRFQQGDFVHAMLPIESPQGYSEYITVPEELVVSSPLNLSKEESAAVPLAAMTAFQALKKGKLTSGDRVLINGASGGVGTFAVQIAKAYGAKVTGVCSCDNTEFVKELGADSVVDYKQSGWMDRCSNYDLVLDLVGNLSVKKSCRTLNSKGYFVSILPTKELEELASQSRQTAGPVVDTFIVEANRNDLEEVDRLISKGLVKPVVSVILPLDEVAEAHRLIESKRVRGKVVLKL